MPKPQPATYRPGVAAGFPLLYATLITLLAVLIASTMPLGVWDILTSLAFTLSILIIGLILLWIRRRAGETELRRDGLRLRLSRRRSVTVAWSDIAELRVHQVLAHRHVLLRTKQNDVHVLPAPRTALLAPDREFDTKVDNIAQWWTATELDATVRRVRLFWTAIVVLVVVLTGYLALLLRNTGVL